MRLGQKVYVALVLSGWIATVAPTVIAQESVTLQGTGATFPAPLYQRWFTEYNKLHPEVQINYQALGSGAGIKQFTEGLVNFGASDAAMTDEEIAAVKDGVVLLPMTAGSIVLAYNLPGRAEGAEALARGLRRHLPRQDHAVERSGDREGESRREASRHRRSPSSRARTAAARRSCSPPT